MSQAGILVTARGPLEKGTDPDRSGKSDKTATET